MNVVSNQPKLSLLARRINGVWSFHSVSNFSFRKASPYLWYTILPYEVGLLSINETNPANVRDTGGPGDYLFKDLEGNLTIFDETMGEMLANGN